MGTTVIQKKKKEKYWFDLSRNNKCRVINPQFGHASVIVFSLDISYFNQESSSGVCEYFFLPMMLRFPFMFTAAKM